MAWLLFEKPGSGSTGGALSFKSSSFSSSDTIVRLTFLINSVLYSGRAKEAVLKDIYLEYENDPGLLAEIVSALPKKMESTLNLYKNRILGSLPKSRDDFDPSSLLSKLDGGDKIVVCDSNTDLPQNWKEIDMKEAFGSVGVDIPNMEDNAEVLTRASALMMVVKLAMMKSL